MMRDHIVGLRLRLVELLCDREESGNGELLEKRLAQLSNFSPQQLRSFFDGTDDDLKVSQLAALADTLSADLILTVVNRKAPNDRTMHAVPVPPPVLIGTREHPVTIRASLPCGHPQGGAFARQTPPVVSDDAKLEDIIAGASGLPSDSLGPRVSGPALPSPLAPPACGDTRQRKRSKV